MTNHPKKTRTELREEIKAVIRQRAGNAEMVCRQFLRQGLCTGGGQGEALRPLPEGTEVEEVEGLKALKEAPCRKGFSPKCHSRESGNP